MKAALRRNLSSTETSNAVIKGQSRLLALQAPQVTASSTTCRQSLKSCSKRQRKCTKRKTEPRKRSLHRPLADLTHRHKLLARARSEKSEAGSNHRHLHALDLALHRSHRHPRSHLSLQRRNHYRHLKRRARAKKIKSCN